VRLIYYARGVDERMFSLMLPRMKGAKDDVVTADTLYTAT
jgi:hypothetical protein